MNKVQFVNVFLNQTILEWRILNQGIKMIANLKYLNKKKFLVNLRCTTFYRIVFVYL